MAVAGFGQWFGKAAQLVVIDEALAPSGLFNTADLDALSFFYDLDELSRLVERLKGAGI